MMFAEWRQQTQHNKMTLRKIFDETAKVWLGKDAVDFIEDNHIKTRVKKSFLLAHGTVAIYNPMSTSITLSPMEEGTDHETLQDITEALVHETRHAWQDKEDLIKTPYRSDLMLENILLTEGDAYSYDRTYAAQVKNPALSPAEIRELRYRHFRHMAALHAHLNLYGNHLVDMPDYINKIYKGL